MRLILSLAAVSAALLNASPSLAGDDITMAEIQEQLKTLSRQVNHLSSIVEQQNAVIRQQEKALEAQKQALEKASLDHVRDIEPAAGDTDRNSAGQTSASPLKMESEDGSVSVRAFGRVHMDATFFDDDASDNADNTNLRRARLGLEGKLGDDFEYESEFDFAGNDVDIKDVNLTYTALSAADITIGHFRSLGMERQTSSNNTSFVERSGPTNTFAPDRQIGAAIKSKEENWSLGVGLFGEEAGNDDTGDDEDHFINARVTANLLGLMQKDPQHVLHIGAGYSFRNTTGDIRYRTRPGTGDGARLIDTGNISSVDNVDLVNAEFGGVFGQAHFLGEYFSSSLSRDGGFADAEFDGYYGQVGYFLTGESRSYSGKSGVFKDTKPTRPFNLGTGGTGAWEVVFRYENTDLNDRGAGILGGEMDSYTGGLNWYATDNIRFLANVIAVDTDENAATAPDDDPIVYNFRAQWDF